jgi:hypothetical protein
MRFGFFLLIFVVIVGVIFGWAGLLTIGIIYLTAVNLLLWVGLKMQMDDVADMAVTHLVTTATDNPVKTCNRTHDDKPSVGNGEIIQFGAGYSKPYDRYALNYGDNNFYKLNKVRALRAYENQTNQARSIRATAKSIYSHELDNNEDRIWWECDVLADSGNAELDAYFK